MKALRRRWGLRGPALTGGPGAGIPAKDLAVAGRVLTLITERANAELAAARA